MSSQKNQYVKFWANDDNFKYLESLEKGSKGTVINQALRYYANLSSYSDSTLGINLEANVRNNTTPRSLNTVNMMDGSTTSITAAASSSSAPMGYSLRDASTYMSSQVAPNPMLCPNGHLWMNGTHKCVNPRCTYGGKQLQQ